MTDLSYKPKKRPEGMETVGGQILALLPFLSVFVWLFLRAL